MMPPSSTYAIETQGLRKVFGAQVAVSSLSLAVPHGQIFGFIGPNGAGKSTSLKMLLGLVRPNAGTGLVLGAPLGDIGVRRQVGFLPEDFRFYEWLTGAELVRLHGRLCGLSPAALRSRVPEVIDRVGLSAHRDRPLRGFSKGMLQRIGLAQALVHEPQLLFLDEPTSGLDPMGRRLVRDVLRAERERGATVFLNSHLLSEIEITCDRVAFIRGGEVVATHDLSGGAEDLVRVAVQARNVTSEVMTGLGEWTDSARQDADMLRFTVVSEKVVPDVIRYLVSTGADVFQVKREHTSLEELFVSIIGEDRGL